jgi:hypothetical protein
MYWKTIITLIVLIILMLFLLEQKIQFIEKMQTSITRDDVDLENDIIINKFIEDNENKKIYIELSKEKFTSIEVPIDKMIYYFPEECPTYDKDIFIYIEIEGLEKYFLPEKKSLILINKGHKWTNTLDTMIIWKK